MLERVTITGIDERVSLGELCEIQHDFPFVEWGMLYSISQGRPRYPSHDWIKNTLLPTIDRHHLNCAMHICGRYTISEMLKNPTMLYASLHCEKFNRIQLNFNAQLFDNDPIHPCISRLPCEVITQFNENNSHLPTILATCANHSILFDQSGGLGLAPKEWTPYVKEVNWCGYAGGLGPDNLAEQLPLIDQAAGGNRYWIDMESKVRDINDQFSIEKVERVLRIVSDFRSKQCYSTPASQVGAMLHSDDPV